MAIRWRKSSCSFANGNCVEVASWRKPPGSYANGSCAGAGQGAAVVGVRDSGDRGSGPVLTFGAAAWERFTAGLKDGGTWALFEAAAKTLGG